MKYIFSYSNPQKHFIDIEFIADNISSDVITVQLPAWRPGRYELGNFAKNIQKFFVEDEKGIVLNFHKVTKDCWEIQTKGAKEIHIKYNYYAVELNAGTTYLDEKQLYVNPVNCCLYIPERINEECQVELRIPADYRVATSMRSAIALRKKEEHYNKRHLIVKDFHELADSPFIASPTIQNNIFILDGVEFNLWFQGECKLDWTKIINDFFIFINEQFIIMKGILPVNEYHFLFQILPYKFHHGVEHLASTVIALGPSYELMHGDLFLEFLSVSSHELFHSWNIKAIRPAEMMPYDYSKENYSRLGFVCEGVTTYYGDFLLFRSGIYSDFEFWRTMLKHLQLHVDNFGRYNTSVADSSFDTWLDGYSEIVPHRKTSIYHEGYLLALMTDILIRKNTNDEKSLDDVICFLYNEFAKKGNGYTESDYKSVIEKTAGTNFDKFFNDYVYGANSYETVLRKCLYIIGIELLESNSNKYHESFYGIKTTLPVVTQITNYCCSEIVSAIYPNSIAEKAGIQLGDEILSINGYAVKNNLSQWSQYFAGTEVMLTVQKNGQVRNISFFPTDKEYYKILCVQKTSTPTVQQIKSYEEWSKRKF
ncbi:MAG: PDZ domain-containing protein [Bacteroidota bacterium]